MSDDFAALCANEPELAALRASVREFLAADRAEFGWEPSVDAWLSSWDDEFSARLADAGFLGLTIPRGVRRARAEPSAPLRGDRGVAGRRRAGGRALDRRPPGRSRPAGLRHRGATAAAAAEDRCGTVLFGDRDERAAGRLGPGRGRRARPPAPTAAGCCPAPRCGPAARISRTRSSCWPAPARSTPSTATPASASSSCRPTPPGITISPIVLMYGEHHFNEVTFDEVFVDDANLLGEVGDGWHQVTAELSFERSGPERILSTAPLLTALIRALADQDDVDDHTAAAVGDLLARLISLRQLSVSVARALADGALAGQRGRAGEGSRHPLRAGVGGAGGRPVLLRRRRYAGTRPGRRPAGGRHGCTRRCSRCAAGPTRCCAAWWHEGMGLR